MKGDYAVAQMVTLLIGMLLVGARRLRHVSFLGNDPMLLLHVGASSLILAARNQPGNIDDSRGAVAFLRDTLRHVRRLLDPETAFHLRGDGALFQCSVIAFLHSARCLYTLRVPMHRWLG